PHKDSTPQKDRHMNTRLASVFLTAAMTAAAPVVADDIKDALQEALQAYEHGDMALAKEHLGYATQLLNQRGADHLAQVLPPPLSGWEGDEAETSAGTTAFFGGGVQASRTYRKNDQQVQVEIIGDSPLMSQMMMVMANPALAGSMGKMIKVGKQRGILDSSGKIMVIINNRFMVSVDGDAEATDKLAYAEAIDFNALQAL